MGFLMMLPCSRALSIKEGCCTARLEINTIKWAKHHSRGSDPFCLPMLKAIMQSYPLFLSH